MSPATRRRRSSTLRSRIAARLDVVAGPDRLADLVEVGHAAMWRRRRRPGAAGFPAAARRCPAAVWTAIGPPMTRILVWFARTRSGAIAAGTWRSGSSAPVRAASSRRRGAAVPGAPRTSRRSPSVLKSLNPSVISSRSASSSSRWASDDRTVAGRGQGRPPAAPATTPTGGVRSSCAIDVAAHTSTGVEDELGQPDLVRIRRLSRCCAEPGGARRSRTLRAPRARSRRRSGTAHRAGRRRTPNAVFSAVPNHRNAPPTSSRRAATMPAPTPPPRSSAGCPAT